MSADMVTTPSGALVDVSVRAGTNWQNITTLSGTITFDTTVITYSQMSFWGLNFPNNAVFTYQGGGVLTWTWQSLITIGPSLNNGDIVFTLQFNVVGGAGSSSPVTFTNSPTPLFWFNGFGWSGNNFALTNGLVTVICGGAGANFTSTDSLLTVNFNEQSGPSATAFLWDFGDGNTSTQSNPTHVYASPGVYTVCLTVTDSCGTDSTCQSITVCPTPAAAFSGQGSQLSYNFTDNSPSAASSWLWDFGDGNVSTQQNPSHTYAIPGNYTVCLTITNACGSDSTCSTFNATCPLPSAAFSDSTDGLTYYFSDLSGNSPTTWLWDFGDGNISTQQNPVHSYAMPGNYTVCLVATSTCGTDSTCMTVSASCPAPNAAFSETASGLVVQFGDLSTQGATAWLWDFGDGNTSTLQSPSHTYSAPGTYLVCQTVSSICGSDSTCSSVTVSCTPPAAAFSQSTSGATVQFTDQSTISPTAWTWDFGDGNSSTQQNPSHTYGMDGDYQVCLIASSICGGDTVCDSLSIVTVGRSLGQGELFVEIHPNPAQDKAKLLLQGGTGILRVNIFDVQGQVTNRIEVGRQAECLLDLRSLAKGLFFLEVETEEGILVEKLLVD